MKIKKILNNQIIKISFPKLNNPIDKKLFIKELKRKTYDSYKYYLNNIIVDQNGNPQVENYFILSDFLKFKSLSRFIILKKILLLLKFKLNLKKYRDANFLKYGIIVHDRHSHNYYHWITDVLPKIIWLIENEELGKYKIILPYFKTSFQYKTLKDLSRNFYQQKKNYNLKVEKIKYISSFHVSGAPRINYLEKTKKFFLRKINIKDNNTKIYISRKKAGKRFLLNENDLIRELKLHKFKIIYMEDLDFYKQVKISANSKIMISCHGAGLTNLIWMKRNSNVIEIRGQGDTTINAYYALSKRMGINYNYYSAKTNRYSLFSSNFNYEIDINNFMNKFINLIKC